MLINITLESLLNTKVMYYLNKDFRNVIFSKLKNKYKDWRIVAKQIGINSRHLFGLRRGFEIRNNKRCKRYISSRELINLSKLSKVNILKFEKNLESIKLGRSGREDCIKLPKKVNLNQAKINSFERALADMVYIKEFENRILLKQPKISKKNKYFTLSSKQIKESRADNYQDRPLPKEIIFNEKFAKEFGKWVGDKCGGSRKVGIGNKEINFMLNFKDLMIKLNQETPKINLVLKPNFKSTKDISKHADVITYNKSQYGNYAYRIDVSNRILKEYVFDYFERNIFSVLYHSPKTVRFAFFAGLIEAEGSISIKDSDISIAFGVKNQENNERVIKLLQKAILYKYLLKLDGINSYISRKYCNTERSSTLKYDIRIKKDNFINFKQKIMPFINHPKKLENLRRLNQKLTKNNEKSLTPEISIGLIGH